MAFARGKIKSESIFPTWQTDRRAFLRIEYEDKRSLITGAIHVDHHNKKEELDNIAIFL